MTLQKSDTRLAGDRVFARWVPTLRGVFGAALRRQRAAIVVALLLWAAALALGIKSAGDGTSLLHSDQDLASGRFWLSVFGTNARISLGLFSGVVLLGTTTLFQVVSTAPLLGAMVAEVVNLRGWGAFAVHVGPHLLPELGAIVLATAAGLSSLVGLVRRMGGWSSRVAFLQALRDAFLLEVIALLSLLVAATIETWISR